MTPFGFPDHDEARNHGEAANEQGWYPDVAIPRANPTYQWNPKGRYCADWELQQDTVK